VVTVGCWNASGTGCPSRAGAAKVTAVLALLLVATLAVLTLALASRLQLLGDVLWIMGASVLGGLLFMAAHPALDGVAPPDDGICEGDPTVSPTPDAMNAMGSIAMERVSIAEASALLGQPLVTFVDARPTYHYAAEHIPGAMNLPAEDAEGLLDTQSLPIPPDGEVITYCDGGSCEQSEYLGLLLRQRDVCQRVRVLEGGWQAWAASGSPTVSGWEVAG
jgi:rhodanese-related sulfurtransferase